MKAEMTVREKVMMGILGVLVLFCVYYFVFLLPTTEKIEYYKSETVLLEDQIVLADAKAAKMKEMQGELDTILTDEESALKGLPAYDNSYHVMNSLSDILEKAQHYSVSFSNVDIQENTVRRNISLSYSCNSYEKAKEILTSIYEGEYRCIFKDLYISGGSSDSCSVSVGITYFEYK